MVPPRLGFSCLTAALYVANILLAACSTPSLEPDGDSSGGGGTGGSGDSPLTIAPTPAGRVIRLSHAQWENSVRDLLHLDENAELSLDFPVQAHPGGYLFDNPAETLQVDQVLAAAYAAAAAELAGRVTSDSAQLARILPEAGAGETERARTFIRDFGGRAFRRPLSAEEVDGYLELFENGRSAYDDVTGFDGGVRLVLEALLQSPHFLYRMETSVERRGDWIPLSGWEMAQRLSYLLTNSMPDEALFSAAAAGGLDEPEEIRSHALRLLESPAARQALGHFQAQLWGIEAYAKVAPSPVLFPSVSSGLGPSALASARLFLEDLVFERQQGLTELLSTRRAFANAELAGVYGLSGDFGDDLVPVELPAGERSGLLTQVGFLAVNATAINPDPIHRGVFVAKRVLCRKIAAPPDDVTPLPPSGEGTNRQIVEEHTQSQPTCRACHEHIINPYGFVFESYDATGAHRTLDRGLPVDASASLLLDAEDVSVDNGVEFAEVLSESYEAHECFAQHLVEYAQGRPSIEADAALVDALGHASRDDRQSIIDLLLTLATSPSFTQRSPEEQP